MAGAFNLTAVLNFAGPANLRPVIARANRMLRGGIRGNVDLRFNAATNRRLAELENRLRRVDSVLVSIRTNAAAAAASLSSLSSSTRAAASGLSRTHTAASRTASSVRDTGRAAQQATSFMFELGKAGGLALKRFAGFTIATGLVFGFVRAISDATAEAIKFERELVKIAQVRSTTLSTLQGLTAEVTRLSKSFGVAGNSLIGVSRILAQTGLSARETRIALEALAKSELAPTFGKIEQTAEGAIAAMRQFKIGAEDLEKVLGSVNAVAGSFAVESEDIIAAIRRAGGVFAAAGGDIKTFTSELKLTRLQEFVALFTSVRATTRESAETIATGLRTVFTRIQRGSTITSLKELGITLQDTKGNFVGVFEAVRRLSDGLKGLDTRTAKFNQIVEELGGFRQVGKVIPLLQQFGDATDALKVAQAGQNSLTTDAAKAQQTLAVQISKVREEFSALIRDLTQTSSFKTIVGLVLRTASGLIKLAESIKPVLPLLTAFAAIKGISAITQFGAGFFGGLRGSTAGTNRAAGVSGAATAGAAASGATSRAATTGNTAALNANTTALTRLTTAVTTLAARPRTGFAQGGIVPGRGNSDTVRAMLTPGEFVLRKDVVRDVGVENLQRLNKGGPVRMISGGAVLARAERNGLSAGSAAALRKKLKADSTFDPRKDQSPAGDELRSVEEAQKTGIQIGLLSLFGQGGGKVRAREVGFSKKLNKQIIIRRGGLSDEFAKQREEELAKNLGVEVKSFARAIQSNFGATQAKGNGGDVLKTIDFPTISGNIFEATIRSLGAPFEQEGVDDALDFPTGVPGNIAKAFRPRVPRNIPSDATRTNKKFNKFILQIERFFLGKGGSKRGQVPQADAVAAEGRTVNAESPEQRAKRLRGLRRRAKGSPRGGETNEVQALLTPGEFVFDKETVDRIGVDKLSKLNAGRNVAGLDLPKFHKGGYVSRFGSGGSVSRYAPGGPVGDSTIAGFLSPDAPEVSAITATLKKFARDLKTAGATLPEITAAIRQARKKLSEGRTEAEARNSGANRIRASRRGLPGQAIGRGTTGDPTTGIVTNSSGRTFTLADDPAADAARRARRSPGDAAADIAASRAADRPPVGPPTPPGGTGFGGSATLTTSAVTGSRPPSQLTTAARNVAAEQGFRGGAGSIGSLEKIIGAKTLGRASGNLGQAMVATNNQLNTVRRRLEQQNLSSNQVRVGLQNYAAALASGKKSTEAFATAQQTAAGASRTRIGGALQTGVNRVGAFAGRVGARVGQSRLGRAAGFGRRGLNTIGRGIGLRGGGGAGAAIGLALAATPLIAKLGERDEEGRQSVSGATTGGALSGALAGGFAGAAFGPAGIAIGVAAGATVSAINSFNEAVKNNAAVELASKTKALDKAFEDFTKGGSLESLEEATKAAASAAKASFEATEAAADNSVGKRIAEFTSGLFEEGSGDIIRGGGVGRFISTRAIGGLDTLTEGVGSLFGFDGSIQDEGAVRRADNEALEKLQKQQSANAVQATGGLTDNIRKQVIESAVKTGKSLEEALSEFDQRFADEVQSSVGGAIIGDDLDQIREDTRRAAAARLLADATIKTGKAFDNITQRLVAAAQAVEKFNAGIAENNATLASITASAQGTSAGTVAATSPFAGSGLLTPAELERAFTSFQDTAGIRGTQFARDLSLGVTGARQIEDSLQDILLNAVGDGNLTASQIEENLRDDTRIRDLPDDVGSGIVRELGALLQSRQSEGGTFDSARIEDLLRSEDIGKRLGSLTGNVAEKLQPFIKVLDTTNKQFESGFKTFITNLNAVNDATDNIAVAQIQNANRVAELQGRSLSIDEQARGEETRVARLNVRGGVAANAGPAAILAEFRSLQSQAEDLRQQRQGIVTGTDGAAVAAAGGLSEALQKNFDAQTKVQSRINSLNKSIQAQTKATDRLKAIQDKLAEFESRRQGARSLVERVATADAEGRFEINQEIAAFLKARAGGELTSQEAQRASNFVRSTEGVLSPEQAQQFQKTLFAALTDRANRVSVAGGILESRPDFVGAGGPGEPTIGALARTGRGETAEEAALIGQFSGILDTQVEFQRVQADILNETAALRTTIFRGFQGAEQAFKNAADEVVRLQQRSEDALAEGRARDAATEARQAGQTLTEKSGALDVAEVTRANAQAAFDAAQKKFDEGLDATDIANLDALKSQLETLKAQEAAARELELAAPKGNTFSNLGGLLQSEANARTNERSAITQQREDVEREISNIEGLEAARDRAKAALESAVASENAARDESTAAMKAELEARKALTEANNNALRVRDEARRREDSRRAAAVEGGRATGGFIPGRFGGADKKTYRVTPGEFIVNRGAAMKHADALQAINSGRAIGAQDGGATSALEIRRQRLALEEAKRQSRINARLNARREAAGIAGPSLPTDLEFLREQKKKEIAQRIVQRTTRKTREEINAERRQANVEKAKAREALKAEVAARDTRSNAQKAADRAEARRKSLEFRGFQNIITKVVGPAKAAGIKTAAQQDALIDQLSDPDHPLHEKYNQIAGGPEGFGTFATTPPEVKRVLRDKAIKRGQTLLESIKNSPGGITETQKQLGREIRESLKRNGEDFSALPNQFTEAARRAIEENERRMSSGFFSRESGGGSLSVTERAARVAAARAAGFGSGSRREVSPRDGFRTVRAEDTEVTTPSAGRRDDRSIGEIINTARRQRGAIQSARGFQSAFGAFGSNANRGPLARARQAEIAAILETIGDGSLAGDFNANVDRFREASRLGLAGFPSRQRRLLEVITDESLPRATREKALGFFQRNQSIASPKDRINTSLGIIREARRFGSPTSEDLARRTFKLIAETGRIPTSDLDNLKKVTGLTDSDIALAQSFFNDSNSRTSQSAFRPRSRPGRGGVRTAFNRGGSVPGVGNTDTIPAILTPGEFVVNKKATAKNLAALQAMNRGVKLNKFQTGTQEGLPFSAPSASGIPTEIKLDNAGVTALNSFNTATQTLSSVAPSLDNFTNAVSNLSRVAQQLQDLTIPDTIEVSIAPVQVNVNVNGAEALANIEEPIRDMISSEVRNQIRQSINPITGETQETFV